MTDWMFATLGVAEGAARGYYVGYLYPRLWRHAKRPGPPCE